MRSILADPIDKPLVWTVSLAWAGVVAALGLVRAGLQVPAWFGLGAGTVLAVVAVVRAPRKWWAWTPLPAAIAVVAFIIVGWIAPVHYVAGTAENPVPVGTPGIILDHDGLRTMDSLNAWEITITDVYQGQSEMYTTEGDVEGVCWFIVGTLRPVEGVFPALPPIVRTLTFEDGSTVDYPNRSGECNREPEGPEAGEYYNWTKTDRAVTFALGFATFDSKTRPVQVAFRDSGSIERSVFEVPVGED